MARGKKPSVEEADEAVEEVLSGDEEQPEEAAEEKPSGRAARKRAPKAAASGKAAKKSKKPKRPPTDESEQEDEEEEEDDTEIMKDVPKYFHRGNFILKKSDIKWEGEKATNDLKDLYLWKIDDKSLIQKYIPLESEGRVLHKCTSMYSGWSFDDRDNYYSITEILDLKPKTDSKEVCVALNLDDLAKVKDK